MKEKSPYLNIDEVSEYLQIPKSTLYKFTMTNTIPCFRIGKRVRFSKESIDRWTKRLEKIKYKKRHKHN